MRELDLEQFWKVLDNFKSYLSDSQHQKEEQDWREFVLDYFGSDYPNNFGYHNGNFADACSIAFDYSIMIAYAATKFPSFDKRIFKDNTFTHEDFYNLSYFWGLLRLYDEDYLSFLALFVEEIRNISLSKILQKDWSDYDDDMSEAEAYDYLSNMSPRYISMILERVNANTELKSLLKKSVLDKDENMFIGTIVNNTIDLRNVSGLINVITIVPQLGDMLRITLNAFKIAGGTNSEKEIRQYLDIFNNEDLYLDDELVKFATDVYQSLSKVTENKSFIPNTDWPYMYRIQTKMQAILLYMHNGIKTVTSKVDTIAKIEDIIQNWLYFKWLNEKILSGEIKPDEYELIEEPLADFRDKYIQQLELPENTLVGAKNPNEYLESNLSPDKWFCIRLYRALVNANYLSYNEDTYYSFIYRMSRDYKGKKEPIQIVWLGEPKEIYYFIYRFCNNAASKMWKKTATFYCLPEGVKLKENGVKNQAKPSPKIESVLKEFFK